MIAELIGRRAVDIVQPNVCWRGGLSEGKKCGILASAFHPGCVPHTFGLPLTLTAGLHLAASLPNTATIEFDRTGDPLMGELLTEPPRIDADSGLQVPTGPGPGVEQNPAVEKWRLER
jgi:D-galactarolactone cycloisomerase